MSGEFIIQDFRLRKPVKLPNGSHTSTVSLRSPTGRDMRMCGFPYSIDMDRSNPDGGGLRFNAGALAKWIAELAGLTSTDVDTMDARDFSSLSQDIVAFFGDSEAEETTDVGSSLTSTSISPPSSVTDPS